MFQLNDRTNSTIRTLGHNHLCGVLHVAWQTKSSVTGQYMICLLYRQYLLLATTGKSEQVYEIQASIGLSDIKIEDADNGRGMFIQVTGTVFAGSD